MIKDLIKLSEESKIPIEEIVRKHERISRRIARREISKGNFDYIKPEENQVVDKSHYQAYNIIKRYFDMRK